MAMRKKQSKQEERKPTVSDYDVLKKPVITEKSSIVGGDGSTVVFEVATTATKVEIRRAVEKIFNVQVSSVRTCNYLGKLKRTTRSAGRRAKFKKAYISLLPGQSIDIVEGL
jgi:large subunit ribosomal protein L23